MRLTTFSLTMGETINMGNFNNVRYEVSGTIQLMPPPTLEDEGKHRDGQIEELRQFLRTKAAATRSQIKGS